MSKIRAYSTVSFSGFLFGDLKKNIPQIVGGLVSKQIVVIRENDYISDIFVETSEQVQNYAIVSIDLETLESELIDIKEYKVNSSMKKPLSHFANLAVAKELIHTLNSKVRNEQTV
jgi:uridine kinase